MTVFHFFSVFEQWPGTIQSYLVLVDTRMKRVASDVVRTYTFDKNVLNEMNNLTGDALKAHNNKDYIGFGRLLSIGWR